VRQTNNKQIKTSKEEEGKPNLKSDKKKGRRKERKAKKKTSLKL